MQPYIYKKRRFPVVTKYYSVPDNWWEQTDILMNVTTEALVIARYDKKKKKTAILTRIKDLPNLRLATECMLKKAGITSVEQLQAKGSVCAYQALQKFHSNALNFALLWALEGAIERIYWSVITPQRRDELLSLLIHTNSTNTVDYVFTELILMQR